MTANGAHEAGFDDRAVIHVEVEGPPDHPSLPFGGGSGPPLAGHQSLPKLDGPCLLVPGWKRVPKEVSNLIPTPPFHVSKKSDLCRQCCAFCGCGCAARSARATLPASVRGSSQTLVLTSISNTGRGDFTLDKFRWTNFIIRISHQNFSRLFFFFFFRKPT